MKKAFFILTLASSATIIQAQSFLQPTNFWDNFYFINPASIDDKYEAIFTLAGRSQKTNITGAPQSLWFAGTYYSNENNFQVGLKFSQNKVGSSSGSNLSLSYAKALELNDEWKLNLGVAGNFQVAGYDTSKINPYFQSYPEVEQYTKNRQKFNADLGIEFVSKEYRIGAASYNLAGLPSRTSNGQRNTNLIYGSYRIFTESSIDYGFGATGFQYGNSYKGAFTAKAIMKFWDTDYEARDEMELSLLYKTPSSIGASLAIHFNPSFSIYYSYDYSLKTANRYSSESHELKIVYRIKNKQACPSCY